MYFAKLFCLYEDSEPSVGKCLKVKSLKIQRTFVLSILLAVIFNSFNSYNNSTCCYPCSLSQIKGKKLKDHQEIVSGPGPVEL